MPLASKLRLIKLQNNSELLRKTLIVNAKRLKPPSKLLRLLLYWLRRLISKKSSARELKMRH